VLVCCRRVATRRDYMRAPSASNWNSWKHETPGTATTACSLCIGKSSPIAHGITWQRANTFIHSGTEKLCHHTFTLQDAVTSVSRWALRPFNMEATQSLETSGSSHQTTRHYIQSFWNAQLHHCKNSKLIFCFMIYLQIGSINQLAYQHY